MLRGGSVHKKIVALLTLTLTFGFNFSATAQQGPGNHHTNPAPQQQSNGITPAQAIGIFGAIVNAVNGGQPNVWGGQPQHGGHNGGHNGGYPPPPAPQPTPWHPGPQPGYPQAQFQKLNSIGSYSASSDARRGADQTVAAMRAQGNIVVLETPVFYSSGYTCTVAYVTRGQW